MVSFSAVILAPATAATTTLKPTITAKKGGLGIGAIVGIAIGCVVVVIIILVVVYMVCIRKKTRKDPTVEPNDNILELKGKILDNYRTNISNQNFVISSNHDRIHDFTVATEHVQFQKKGHVLY